MKAKSVLVPAAAAILILAHPAASQTLAGRAATALNGFGAALAVGEGEVFIGEPNNTMRPGIVYRFARGATGWSEQAQLRAGDARDGDGFGASLAIEGLRLAVGAANQNQGRGAVYIFERNAAGAWQQAARLVADDTAAGSGFGRAVAFAGDEVLVGASGHTDRTGTVYRFRRAANGAWSGVGRISASDAAVRSAFGTALAVSGDLLVVSAPEMNSTGAAYAFRRESGAWTEAGRITPAGSAQNDGFGASLRIEADRLLVGAPGMDNRAGSVVAFQRDAATGQWREAMRLRPFDPRPRMGFGGAIASAGDHVWISGGGAIYLFEHDERGDWTGVRKLRGDVPGANFAGAIAAAGEIVVAGTPGRDFGTGAAVIFERGDRTDLWAARTTVMSEPEGIDPIVGNKVDCTANRAAGIFDCNDVDLLGFLPITGLTSTRGTQLNDIWGWTDPETGKEYALVGRFDGTSFVDISDPSNPVLVGDLPRTAGANPAAWRDIKVYRDHAFIVSDGAGVHGMQVFDLARLRQFRGEPLLLDEDAHYDRINSAHNIVINEETGFAYSVGGSSGGETCGGGLHMIDIREPKSPKFAGCFADPQTGRASTGYSHDAQCVTYRGPDRDYQGREICLGSNETALSIADVTDKQNPKAVARASYPDVGYSHQGWFTEDQRYFYMDDELDELSGNLAGTRTLVWDLADLDDPQLIKQHYGATRASDHNLYIRDNLMYQSNYLSGLRILDISDPANPVEVGSFDSVPWGENNPGFGGSWSNYPFFRSGNIVFTSMQQGLFIVRRTPRVIS
jgi:choice-of-anchor B domain-containing protein